MVSLRLVYTNTNSSALITEKLLVRQTQKPRGKPGPHNCCSLNAFAGGWRRGHNAAKFCSTLALPSRHLMMSHATKSSQIILYTVSLLKCNLMLAMTYSTSICKLWFIEGIRHIMRFTDTGLW